MNCPNCNETLLMTERHQVEIDYCPKCRGVWLDKGELDKLMDYAASQSQAPSPQAAAPRYDERPRDDRYDNRERYEQHDPRGQQYDSRDSRDSRDYNQRYPKKKKSFLSDFFDFD